MIEPDRTFPDFLDRVVEFPGNISYELLDTLAEYRICHDGTPREARIVFNSKRLGPADENEISYVIKVKIQVPANPNEGPQGPQEGPSTTTAAEIDVLERFEKANNPYVPHLVAWKRETQSDKGPVPGGYLTYTVMTKLPGETLYNLGFLEMQRQEQEEIVRKFMPALRSIHALGIEPVDRGLRNILWDAETKKCSIIDFELWDETSPASGKDEGAELYRWGLGKLPPINNWATAWRLSQR